VFNQSDVARKAGVSIMTVSRVINNSGYVKEETRQRVFAAIKELGYYTNNLGRSLSQGQVNIISVLAPIERGAVENDPYFTRLLYGIELALVERSYDLLLSTQRTHQVNGKYEFDYFRPYMERKADGLILMGAKLTPADIATIEKRHIPFCVIGDRPETNAVDIVDTENRQDFKQILEQVWQFGHRRICFVGIDEQNFNIMERFEGYREFLADKGIPFRDEFVIRTPNSQDDGVEAFQHIMRLPELPTAIVCSTDISAIGVTTEARRLGLRIPEDVSITGFDGIPIGRYMHPVLSSMLQPLEAMGRQAVELLLERIANPQLEGRKLFHNSVLLSGESIAPPSR